jgi:hypothetical protein
VDPQRKVEAKNEAAKDDTTDDDYLRLLRTLNKQGVRKEANGPSKEHKQVTPSDDSSDERPVQKKSKRPATPSDSEEERKPKRTDSDETKPTRTKTKPETPQDTPAK